MSMTRPAPYENFAKTDFLIVKIRLASVAQLAEQRTRNA